MKTPSFPLFKFILSTLLLGVCLANAQTTAFTYQGRLNDGPSAAHGSYDLTFALFNGGSGAGQIGNTVTNLNTSVSNGLFTVTLDFGASGFDGNARWLEIRVRTNNGAQSFVPLSPRQQITAAPYALYAPQAGTAAIAIDVTANAVGTPGLRSSSVNSEKIVDGSVTAADVNSGSFSNTFWKVNGNAGANPINGAFFGTTDNQPVEFRVNGARALRLEPTAGSNTVNLIGGSAQNLVGPSVEAATIAGGGSELSPNTITASYATIGGGTSNTVAGSWSTIAGGTENNVTGDYSTVSGGAQNVIVATADAATIGGGDGNIIQSVTTWSTIGGGRINVVGSNNFSATIAGGEKNVVQTNASFSSIGGGLLNWTASEYTTLGGGKTNKIQTNAIYATISGGSDNIIRSNSWRSTVGGGFANTIGAPEGTVSGGAFNSALGFSSTIGGGGGNAASGEWSTIAGGRENRLTNANYATIGGGLQNIVQTNSDFATIGGGGGNTVQARGHFATIPGGRLNSATNYAFAAGTRAKAIHPGAFVWADSTDADFASSGPNQFMIRASGGVGINIANPGDASLAVGGNVNVEGIVSANAFSGASATTPVVISPKINTSGNVPLELFVNSQRGMRIEPTASPNTVNVIGGSAINLVGAGTVGATIGGGGAGIYLGIERPNQVEADFGTVSGGGENTIQPGARYATISGGSQNMIQPDAIYGSIGGGSGNTIQTNAWYSTIAGGDRNAIQPNAGDATIGGGRANKIQPDGDLATIGGGRENTIQYLASHATIGGGGDNTIQTNAAYATIPGGRENSATNYAFAAGRRAKANHTGAFVWADSTDADFASTANNQFLVRAAGGVGINKNNPASALDVNGTARIQGANNWGVSGGEGDFRVGNDSYRFKIGVANAGGGAGDIWMRAHGGIERVNLKAPGGTRILSNEAETSGVSLAANGTAWAVISDRNVKKDFAALDSVKVLEKLAALPITQWHYNWESVETTPHIGPMAQDFKAAFYPGTDDKSITTQEADGVALAAIQGLNQKLKDELTRRDKENAELKQRLSKLEQLMSKMTNQKD